MSEPVTCERYAPCVGQVFALRDAAPDLRLELLEATPLAERAQPPADRVPFALLFRGPPAPALAQGVYRLHHDALGEDAIFLVPVGVDGDGALYEAVFN